MRIYMDTETAQIITEQELRTEFMTYEPNSLKPMIIVLSVMCGIVAVKTDFFRK